MRDSRKAAAYSNIPVKGVKCSWPNKRSLGDADPDTVFE
jgi:hypothetical protein